MLKDIKTIELDNCEELIEKKSRFIATLKYVESEEEAINKIKEIKKVYYDARHNCYAYRVIENGEIIQRSNDDGEPSGTAGAPMLNILEKNEIVNVLIVVTRYFGGILLGTGGLVKAYSGSLQKAIQNNRLLEKEYGYEAEVIVDYENLKKIEYFFKTNNITVINKEYLEKIRYIVDLSNEDYEKIKTIFPENVFKNIKYKIIGEKIISKKSIK